MRARFLPGIGVVAAVVGAMIAAPGEIEVGVEGRVLVVRPRGLEALWALRTRVEVPLAEIESVEVIDRAEAPPRGFRLPGSYLPGVIAAGSFGVGAERSFWAVRRAPRLLLITCRPGNPYRRLVLQVSDPDATAAMLRGALVG